MGVRRLIGIDLAWGAADGSEPERSGCAELVWANGKKGGKLELTRFDVLGRVDEIVDWIQPNDGEWVVAIDAPLVICNKTKERPAEEQARRFYRPFEASARPTKLENPQFRKHYQGRMLRKQLKKLGGSLVERAEHLRDGPLFFETYPHIAIVELFRLDRSIKYKKGQCQRKGGVGCQQKGQQKLAKAIREHLCSGLDKPQLQSTRQLAKLLPEPFPDLGGQALKDREDELDGLICAYTAAWLDAERDLVGLGEVGKGVMIAPRVQGIGPMLP